MPERISTNSEHTRVTILGVGDDNLGDAGLPIRALQAISPQPGASPTVIDLIELRHLQMEDALKLRGAELVLFVDASAEVKPPYEFRELPHPSSQPPANLHDALTPMDLLRVVATMDRQSAPPTGFTLTLCGERFERGSVLSAPALARQDNAIELIEELLENPHGAFWRSFINAG